MNQIPEHPNMVSKARSLGYEAAVELYERDLTIALMAKKEAEDELAQARQPQRKTNVAWAVTCGLLFVWALSEHFRWGY